MRTISCILAAALATPLLSYAAESKPLLLNGEYELVSLKQAGKAIKLDAKQRPSLQVGEDGRVSGFAACNHFHGELQANPLKIGPLATTRMMCAPVQMQVETAYLQVLQGAEQLQMHKKGQVLRVKDGQGGELRLQRTPAVRTAELWVGPETKPCSAGVMKMDCLQVKTSATGEWENFYNSIAGFQPEAGKSYRLKVKIEKVANPPADASNLRYSLIKVLEQQ
ncbi:META and DUF4377 domain-containing protein [Chitinibacter sp. ZOR0017]|uniref:META and DUF4377 domain-containing protein n=1 Tax=Chitinibacter sp. ZOR0017 TaxID=1339254 RepID=UPI00068C941A|nr:META and DUF4377 domain-containing protein [Chitinibacter sp. ZOR0017]